MGKKKTRRKKGTDMTTVILLAIGLYLITRQSAPVKAPALPSTTEPDRLPIGRLRRQLQQYA